MGEGLAGQVVADAGPIIHLHEIARLRLLRTFEATHLPAAVLREIESRVPPPRLAELANTHVHQVTGAAEIDEVLRLVPSVKLHPGELECLALCRRTRIPLLLTDDLAAREAAKALGITPVGSLGVVVRAYVQGTLSSGEAEESLEALHRESSLFVTHAIVELALEQLRKLK